MADEKKELGQLKGLRHACGELTNVFVVHSADMKTYKTYMGCPKCGLRSFVLLTSKPWEDTNIKPDAEMGKVN